jgi:hypothetical protein
MEEKERLEFLEAEREFEEERKNKLQTDSYIEDKIRREALGSFERSDELARDLKDNPFGN